MTSLGHLLKTELSWLKDNANLSVLKLDGIDWRDLKFPNDESYRGGWKDSRPEGEGCYTWADGSTYEGAWHAGLKHGWGKYRWPNGACYQGEWQDGFMHGHGTFESPDGARYVGNWVGNLKHGIGKKTYANGDSYEGLWANGKADGPGRYVWHNGNQYDGEWRAGKMHGQGTLKWITGERYDGEWQEGQEGGVGVFTWRDGSTYEGFWAGGKKTGVGVFRPALNAAGVLPASDPSARSPARAMAGAAAAEAAAAGGAAGEAGEAAQQQQQQQQPGSPGSPVAADAPLDSPAAASAARHRRDLLAADATRAGAAGAVAAAGAAAAGAAQHLGEMVFVCAYETGKLVHEEVLSTLDLELIFGPSKALVEKKRRLARGRKRQVRLGETIFKGHRSYDLMLNLQLGIRYTITTLNKLPPPKSIGDEHFKEKVWLRFPREGSEVTPPHPSNDFKWKDYLPTAFKQLRGLFGIDNSLYILSICGDQALREMPSPGKSGSVFFISHDDQFMIKTMHKEEIKLLLSMLPKYYRHVQRNPHTLLTRFYGVHRVKPSHGRKVRFVVMNNIFRTDLDLHRKYDLKGSTHGRTAGPRPGPNAIRKDLDLDAAFHTDPKTRDRVVAQLAADCAFLEEIRVMDYSLLMGVHCRGRGGGGGETSATPLNTDKEDGAPYLSAGEGQDELTEVEAEGSDDGTFAELEAAPAAASSSSWLPARGSSSGGIVSGSEPSARNLAAAAAPGPAAGGLGRSPSPVRTGRSMPAGPAAAPTSDSDGEMARSMHSLTIEQYTSPREGRSPSFLLKGLSWRSFTARRPSEPQLAPASALHPGPTQLPAPSAQITPRVQPSIVPTPRLATTPPPPVLAAASSKQLRPMAATAGIAAALRAAAAEANAAESGAAGGGAGERQPAANGRAPGAAAAAAQQQEQKRANGGQSGGISWRSDAVQLPEQQLVLPEGLPASPTGSALAGAGQGAGKTADTSTALTARSRSSTLGVIQESSGQQGAEGSPGEGGDGQSPGQTAAAAAAAPRGGGQQTPPSAAAAAAPTSLPSGTWDSLDSTPASSWGGTPTAAAAAAPRGLPLPNGIPRIELQRTPTPVLAPQRESNDWQQYAESVSDASMSAGTSAGTASGQRSTGRQGHSSGRAAAAVTPDSDATSSSKPGLWSSMRRRTAPLPNSPGPGSGGTDLSGLLAAAADRGGPASAPATARSPLALTPNSAAAAHQHRLAQAAGPGDAPPGTPPASGTPGRPPLPAAAAAERADTPTPPSGRTRSNDPQPPAPPTVGLARTSSAPAGRLLAAAAGAGGSEEDGRRWRRPAAAAFHQRGVSMVVGREASVVDLTSPEAVALQDRINQRLSHKVTDRLVQDLLKLARYRMVGAVSRNASSRYARMPTTVLAARHMRRTSSGGERGASRERGQGGSGGDTLASSLDEEVPPGLLAGAGGGAQEEQLAAAAAAAGGNAQLAIAAAGQAGAAAVAAPQRLGMRLPAVAMSHQAGEPPQQVLLFFGIIDFLQEYNMRKMLEHGLKAVVNDGKAISVVEPRAYAKRFLRFMEKVFPTGPAPAPTAQQQQTSPPR